MKTLDIIWLFVYVKSPGLLYASQIHQQGLWDATAINLSFNNCVCRWSKLCICEFVFSASISMQWLTVPVLHWLIRRVIPVYGLFFTKPLITSYSSKWDTGVKSRLLPKNAPVSIHNSIQDSMHHCYTSHHGSHACQSISSFITFESCLARHEYESRTLQSYLHTTASTGNTMIVLTAVANLELLGQSSCPRVVASDRLLLATILPGACPAVSLDSSLSVFRGLTHFLTKKTSICWSITFTFLYSHSKAVITCDDPFCFGPRWWVEGISSVELTQANKGPRSGDNNGCTIWQSTRWRW